MEKIKTSYKIEIRPSVLYLDDIEQICNVFQESNAEIKIKTDDYMFKNVKELTKLNTEFISTLHISSTNPYISLDFTKANISIYAEDTLIARGICDKIKSILNRCCKKPWWLYDAIACSTLGICIIILPSLTTVFLLLGGKIDGVLWFPCIFLGSFLFSIILLRLGWAISVTKHSTIYLKRRSCVDPFWKRKKDDIILIILTAVISSSLTLLVAKLFK